MLKVILTAYNMPSECDEADFDAWAAFVQKNIDESVGFPVNVEQHPYRNGPERDTIAGEAEGSRDRENIKDALRELWDRFCATPEAWPRKD